MPRWRICSAFMFGRTAAISAASAPTRVKTRMWWRMVRMRSTSIAGESFRDAASAGDIAAAAPARQGSERLSLSGQPLAHGAERRRVVTPARKRGAPMDLKDKSLLREQCFVGGQWIGTPAIAVTDPATAGVIARVPRFGAGETRDAI